jgi:hypothetical protein
VDIVNSVYSSAAKFQQDQFNERFKEIYNTIQEIVREEVLKALMSRRSEDKREELREQLSPEMRKELAKAETSRQLLDFQATLHEVANDITYRLMSRLKPLIKFYVDMTMRPFETQFDKMLAGIMERQGYRPPIPKLKLPRPEEETSTEQSQEQNQQEQQKTNEQTQQNQTTRT